MHRILTAPPALIGDVPLPIGRALDKLLHKDPELRVKSASEAAELLRGIDLDALPDKLDCSSRELGTTMTSTGSGVRPLTTGQMHAPLPTTSSKLVLGILASLLVIALGGWVLMRGAPADGVSSPTSSPETPAPSAIVEPIPEEAGPVPEDVVPEEVPVVLEEAVPVEAARPVPPRRAPGRVSMRSDTVMDLPPPEVTNIELTMAPPTPAMNAAMGTWTGEIIE